MLVHPQRFGSVRYETTDDVETVVADTCESHNAPAAPQCCPASQRWVLEGILVAPDAPGGGESNAVAGVLAGPEGAVARHEVAVFRSEWVEAG